METMQGVEYVCPVCGETRVASLPDLYKHIIDNHADWILEHSQLAAQLTGNGTDKKVVIATPDEAVTAPAGYVAIMDAGDATKPAVEIMNADVERIGTNEVESETTSLPIAKLYFFEKSKGTALAGVNGGAVIVVLALLAVGVYIWGKNRKKRGKR